MAGVASLAVKEVCGRGLAARSGWIDLGAGRGGWMIGRSRRRRAARVDLCRYGRICQPTGQSGAVRLGPVRLRSP